MALCYCKIFTYHHSTGFFAKMAPIAVNKRPLKLLGTYLTRSISVNSTKPLRNTRIYRWLLPIASCPRIIILCWRWCPSITTLWGSSRIPSLLLRCPWIPPTWCIWCSWVTRWRRGSTSTRISSL